MIDTPPVHLFDEATRVTAGDSRWQGRTSPDYWAFVGPFGGVTAATVLRALIQHPQIQGDPLAVTVNYCAPIAEGPFDLDVRLVKANRSSQHWCVELSQGDADAATLATAVFAERRPSWSHQPAVKPEAPPFDQVKRHPDTNMSWTRQYDFRFVEGRPAFVASATGVPHSSYSRLWISDRKPRKLDCLSLLSMSDAFFGRVFHARGELVPFGTVSLTTYFHVSREELAAEDITHVLATADAKVFNRSYGDQHGELWSPSGRLLATTTQIAYFKA
ncbi:acyl-CoA thioesterase [Bradyrhizobium oligotrophicum S58]